MFGVHGARFLSLTARQYAGSSYRKLTLKTASPIKTRFAQALVVFSMSSSVGIVCASNFGEFLKNANFIDLDDDDED